MQYFQRRAIPSIIIARAIDPEEDNWLVLKGMQNICTAVDTDTPIYSRAFLLNKSNNEETKWKSCVHVLSLPLLSSSSRFRCMTVHFFTSTSSLCNWFPLQKIPDSLNSFVPGYCVASPRAIDCARACLSVFSQCFARAGSQSVVLLSPPSLLLFQLPPSFSPSLSSSLCFPCLSLLNPYSRCMGL